MESHATTVKQVLNKYNIDIQVYQQAQPIASNCNEICFINNNDPDTSTSVLWVNGTLPILPGGFFNVPGNIQELDTTQYSIKFTGAEPHNCVVIKKSYQNLQPE